ncbi:hypothetical protein FRC02_012431 [Tulasnella sp. 418]|nr:hypothetical protein FRC02_012431 [Tulasnella sp. 418]
MLFAFRFMSASTSSNASRAATRLAATTRHFSSSSSDRMAIQNITLFGGGLMGAGIVQVAAHNGFKVVLCDVNEKAIENGRNIISKSIARVAKKLHPEDTSAQNALVSSVFENITTTTDPVEAVKDADLVVEAIVENLKIKQDLFGMLDKEAKEDCLFATNTSSLSVREIAETCSDARRKSPQMKLVEVIKAPETSDETIQALLEVCKRMKKTAVNCKDTPGFIVNRLLVPYMHEAIKMLERGDASAEDIDTAMKLGAGYPMGPLELADFVGLDTTNHIVTGWREKIEQGVEKDLSKDLVAESKILTKLVNEGKLGRKAGEGFFKY